MSLMSDLAIFHFEQLQAAEGIPATIAVAGLATSCNATVVLGRVDSQAVTDREATYADDAQDVLILATDYRPNGTSPSLPTDGDVISLSVGTETWTLEARPPGDSQQCFNRWRGGGVFRIHTKITNRTPIS